MSSTYTKDEWKALPEETRMHIERETLFHHLGVAGVPAAERLLAALHDGEVDGGFYWDEEADCGCIIGTLATAAEQANIDYDFDPNVLHELGYRNAALPLVGGFTGYDAIETLAMNVDEGDTPANNETAAKIATWIREWLDAQVAA